MTKQSRDDVKRLLEGSAHLLVMVGVPSEQINVCSGPRYRVNHFIKAFDWLHDFILSDEYVEVARVWNMRRPSDWANYAFLGVEGLQEQVLMQEAGRKLLKRWRLKRPRMFGPDRPVEENDNGDDSGSD